MEKTIAIRNTEITFSIWDLGGCYLLVILKIGRLINLCSNDGYRAARICKYVTSSLQ